MRIFRSAAAGLAGALALNLLHETVRKFDPAAPRIDLLGEEAVLKSADALDLEAPGPENLYAVTLAGDVVSNAAYYAMIGMGGKKGVFLRAITLGLAAGIGALKLPEPMGLDDTPVAGSGKRKIMTVGYYLFGALVTAAALNLLSKKE